ncbi:MAG: c-type cytochrome biogenesis protein CcmI [Hydrogenophaga sp.]|nr:c-type cytochrome biogenesis protein CcmI [Gammaproteobacteria bacterium]
MITFWFGAMLMAAVTLTLLIPPLLGRGRWAGVDRDRLNVSLYEDRLAELSQELADDEITAEQLAVARRELQRELLNTTTGEDASSGPAKSGRWAALVVGSAVPLLAVVLYWQIGAPQVAQHPHAATEQMPDDMNNLVAALQQRLERNPNDTEGWKLLGRTLLFMERIDEAGWAIGRAIEMAGSEADPDLLAEYADILSFSQGGSLEGEPIRWVRQALAVNPDTPRALWLAGMHAYELGDLHTALKHWRHLLTRLPPEDESTAALRATIAETEAGIARGLPSP